MDKITFTRKELYDLIWSQSMLSISRRFDISDTGLRKMCMRLRVPTPPPGYWRQVERGKNPPKRKLGSGRINGPSSVTLVKREQPKSSIPYVLLKQQIEHDNKEELKVPPRFNAAQLHPSIIKACMFMKHEQFHFLDELRIDVAPINRKYALRLLNSIFLLLTKRGHQIAGNDLLIHGTRWSFSLVEKTETPSDGSPPKRYKPTNLFTFKVKGHCTHVWHDSKHSRLEDKLSAMVARMEISTGEYIEHQAIERKRQDEWQERQRIAGEERQQRERDRAEMERLRQKELDEFRNLAGSADRWFRSRIIRDYINEVMRKTMSHGTLSEELIDWVVWAKKKCNWYDPLLNAADELMEGVDRTTLTISSRSKTISGD